MKKIIIGVGVAGLLLAGCSSGAAEVESKTIVAKPYAPPVEARLEATSAGESASPTPVQAQGFAAPMDEELMQGCRDFKQVAETFGITTADGLIQLAQRAAKAPGAIEPGAETWDTETDSKRAAIRKAAEMAVGGGC